MLQGEKLRGKCYKGKNVTGENVTGENVSGENGVSPAKHFHEYPFYERRNGKLILETSKPRHTCIFLKITFTFSTKCQNIHKMNIELFTCANNHSDCYHLLLYAKLFYHRT